MKLNWAEKALMNNPVRAALQRGFEAKLLERIGGRIDGELALEIGCGRGVGVEIILERFKARKVVAFDLDPDMVERARRRLGRFGEKVELHVGDATNIQAPPGVFDAVFDFGIVHHVPGWQTAIAEVHRVLRPGGKFYFEEVTSHALDRWTYRTFFEHPRENRFSGEEFVQELNRQGLRVTASYSLFFGDFVVGVARKAGEQTQVA